MPFECRVVVGRVPSRWVRGCGRLAGVGGCVVVIVVVDVPLREVAEPFRQLFLAMMMLGLLRLAVCFGLGYSL